MNPVNPVKIVLNGEPFELERPVTVSKLLEQLNIDPRRVAVEHNLVVLKRAAYDSTLLKEGDEVEVVNFVGGGMRGQVARARGCCWSCGRDQPDDAEPKQTPNAGFFK